MKRCSPSVAAPLLASAAMALLSGCRHSEMQRCVDENNKVVDDKLCAGQPQDAARQRQLQDQQRQHGGVGFIPFIPLYRYYYGGTGGYRLGSPVTGGGYAPMPGRTYSTIRGGFGSTHGGGGEGGEGGGHGSGHGGGAGE